MFSKALLLEFLFFSFEETLIQDTIKAIIRSYSKWFQNLGSGLRARRSPMKKRSIQGVCEHFEEGCNTAIGP